MNTTWYEKGIAKAREQERRDLLREQLEERFGPLSSTVRERLENLPAERLTPMIKAILRAASLEDLGLAD